MLTAPLPLFAAWNGAFYAPGQTLDPECAPTDAYCAVDRSQVPHDLTLKDDGTTAPVSIETMDPNGLMIRVDGNDALYLLSSGAIRIGTTTGSTRLAVGGGIATDQLELNGQILTNFLGHGISVLGGALTLDTTGDWSGTFGGQEGRYYLNRANQTGTQPASSISGFDAEVGSIIAGTTTDALSEGSTHQYYTDDRAHAAFAAGAGLSYTSASGIFAIAPGYAVSLIASSTNWNSFYDAPSSRITAGTNLTWSGNTLHALSNTAMRSLFSATGPLSYDASIGTFSLSTTTISGSGSGFNADLLDGLDSTYFIANSFSTTSANSWLATKTTDAVSEGLINQYYTQNRFNTAFTAKSTSNLTEGSNLYFTNVRADARVAQGIASAFAATTTDALAEGITNRYYTDAHARSALSSSDAGLTYTSGTGILSVTPGYTSVLVASTTDWQSAYVYRITAASTPLSVAGNTISITDASADGSTKGAAAFTTSDFNSSTGLISLDYTNGQKATAAQPGFLSAADWTAFSGKESPLTFLYPLVRTGASVSLAFGTTTSNTWSGTNTFINGVVTNVLTLGSVNGFLKASAGAVAPALVSLSTDVSGILPVQSGGTGQGSIQSGRLIYGNGTGALATTTGETAGYVLQYDGAKPTWVATTSLGFPQVSTGTVTSVGLTVPTGFSISESPVTASGTLSLSFAAGYAVPLIASTSEWAGFTATPSSRIAAGTNLTWNGNTLNGPADSYIRALFSASTSLSYNATTGAFAFSTTTISGSGSGFNADLLDGLDSTYFIANSFSTTSANSWLAIKSTSNLSEGTNLYFTNARADARVAQGIAAAFAGTTTDALSEGLSNLYFTNARARNAVYSGAVALTYASSTGAFSLTPAYTIPLIASTTNWDSLYSTPSSRIIAGLNLSWAGNTLNGPTDSYIRNLFSGTSPLTYSSSTGAFALGTVGVGNGGTGQTTFTAGQLLYGNGVGGLQSVATSSVTTGTGVSVTGGGAVVGAGGLTITNTGVTSTVAGTGIGVSSATGAVTLTNTGIISLSCSTITCSGTNPATFSIGVGAITNTQLANASVTVTAGSGLSGGGLVALGGTISLANSGVIAIGPTGQTITGTVTIASSTTTLNGLTFGNTITSSGSTLTWKPAISGVLSLAGGGSGTTTFATGGVVFSDGTKLTQSATPTSFFWDETNKRLGIGTGTPATALDVNGSITTQATKSCGISTLAALGTDSTGKVQCITIIATSDKRLKKDIEPLEGAQGLELINSLSPVSYTWKDPSVYGGTTALQYGFIAQDAQQVDPNLVGTTTATALTPDKTYFFNYIGLIAPLVKAIQELDVHMTTLASGVFDTITTHHVHTDELCVGSTCVTQEEFMQMVQRREQSQPSTSGTSLSAEPEQSQDDSTSSAPLVPDTSVQASSSDSTSSSFQDVSL